MKERTKAYMAGLMDAEGCYGIYREAHGHYTPHIIFTSSHRPLATWLVKHFGGVCSFRKHGQEHYKPYFHWQLNGKNATPAFLRSVLPHSRVKQDQILTMLDFLSAKEAKDKPRQEELCSKIKAQKSEPRNDRTLDGSATDKLTHAYLAGIFDGEGSISLYGHRRKGDVALHYVKFVGVTNTDLSLLNFFKRVYGGAIRSKKQPGKPCYEWNIRGRDEIEKFLLRLLPYLTVKRERAKIMLSFVRLSDGHLHPQERYAAYQQMRSLVTTRNAKPMVQSDLTGDRESEPMTT